MWHVPEQLHDASLRCMRRLMHCLLLLPPRPRVQLRLLYTIGLLFYLIFFFKWRIGFNYHVVYDIKNDHVSRIIDLLNFVALITTHAIVVMELLWKNRSEQVEQQLQRVRHILRVQFDHNVNLEQIRWYCNILFVSLILRLLLLATQTVYVNMMTDTSVLLFYGFYSEMVLLTRFTEFSMYSALILCFYRDLRQVSTDLMAELERTRFEIWSVRRILLDRLHMLQHLHGLLWNTIRDIECNFELSLIFVMLKLFVDTSVLPYWVYISISSTKNMAVILYCITEQFCKLVEIIVPCLICNRCELHQRQLRATCHTVSSDRRNIQLNLSLLRISLQLGQEQCFFSAGGLFVINNVTLGKFIFGMASYIVICIQFRESMLSHSLEDE